MNQVEKRRQFIINFMYFAIVLGVSFLLIKFGLPMIMPFAIAFVIAYLLRTPIRFIENRFKLHHKVSAILVVLLFYSTIGVLISLLIIKASSTAEEIFKNLPEIYKYHIEPILLGIANNIEKSALALDSGLVAAIEDMIQDFVRSLGDIISGFSMNVIGIISNMASSLPRLFIQLVLTIIATFFIALDYNKLTGFVLRQLSNEKSKVVMQIKEYVSETLLVCIRSYGLIMFITFVELSIGLTIIGVENALLIALGIAIFDILPVLGTGGIMIPWTVFTAIQGDFPLALGLLMVYVIITIIRNIIEPKIVGSQIGLHPVVTLISMFVGVQLLGGIGLFGFPIGLSLLKHLNDNGTITFLKDSE